MSKRHVSYIKPNEPSFLKKLKQQAGYKEGPTIDTKREDLGSVAAEDLVDTEEEQPTVVVLKPGDLTAEEAAQETEKFRKDLEDAPADLNSRILFKAPRKSSVPEKTGETSSKRKTTTEVKSSKKLKNKKLLSFDEEEDD